MGHRILYALLCLAATTPSLHLPAHHWGRKPKEYKHCSNCTSRETTIYPAELQKDVSKSSMNTPVKYQEHDKHTAPDQEQGWYQAAECAYHHLLNWTMQSSIWMTSLPPILRLPSHHSYHLEVIGQQSLGMRQMKAKGKSEAGFLSN